MEMEFQSDTVLCKGEDFVLDVVTDADRLDLINRASGHIVAEVSLPYRIGVPESDSCYTLHMRRDGEGCESFIDFCFTVVKAGIPDTTRLDACKGDTVFLDGQIYIDDDLHCRALISSGGCDSLLCIAVQFQDTLFGFGSVMICERDSVWYDGQWLDASGVYSSTGESAFGCDSVHTLTLDVTPLGIRQLDYELCEGDSIEVGGRYYSRDTVFERFVGSVVGCDSIHIVGIEVRDTSIEYMRYELCEGDSVWIGGAWISEAGRVEEIWMGENGCDSTVIHVIDKAGLPSEVAVAVDCEDGVVEVKIDLPVGWGVEWGNGETTVETTYTEGAIVDTAQVFHESGCALEKVYTIPTLPDMSGIKEIRDTILENGATMNLGVLQDTVGWDIHWAPGDAVDCADCFETVLRSGASGTISYEFEHTSGCKYDYAFVVRRLEGGALYIPNVFSPNGDGVNEVWEVHLTPRVEKVEQGWLYDRWGNVLREWTNTREVRWDGTFRGEKKNGGVYVYYLIYRTTDGRRIEVVGDVTVVR